MSPKGEIVAREQVVLEGSTSNNEAEYDVLISGLKMCLTQGIQRLMVKGDALHIVKQILGIWDCKNERLRSKVTVIRKLCGQFQEVHHYHIPRKENEDANLLTQQDITGQDEVQVIIVVATMKGPQYADQPLLGRHAPSDSGASLVGFRHGFHPRYEIYTEFTSFKLILRELLAPRLSPYCPTVAHGVSSTFDPVRHADLSDFGVFSVALAFVFNVGAVLRLDKSNLLARRKQVNSLAIGRIRLKFTAVLKDKIVNLDSCPKVNPKIKICGVTNAKDATLAAQAGASFVGMILWPKSKRSICVSTAKEIAHAVRFHKAEPVGVFVDEDAETIDSVCSIAGIHIAQLHGERARASLTDLPSHLETIYVVHVDKNGFLQTPLPESNSVDWILLDSLQGGSGHSFDWEQLKNLSIKSRKGWLLAGGLNPENVVTAISMLKPDGVDVSSGVTMPDGLLKDPARVVSFIDAVKGCTIFI
ncbi:hypothetical protein L7F22_049808 [Adiantum nelumboides]|nr:hypothetical protein [Adiantum nelumboides]